MGLTAITQTVHVDLNTGKSIPTVFVHQNDTSRTIIFKVTNNGTPFDLSDYTIKFAYKSPIVNGQYSVIAGASMVDGEIESEQIGLVYFTPTDDYTSIGGVGLLTMILTPSDQTENVRPVNIRLVVQKSADGANEIAGSSDFPTTLEGFVDEWIDANAENQVENWLNGNASERVHDWVDDALSDAELQPMINTWLDDHPEATTTVQDGSITESKLNSSVSDKLDECGYSSENFTRTIDDTSYREGEGSNAIFACAMTWLKNNDKLYYGNGTTCNSFRITGEATVSPIDDAEDATVQSGKYPLDCMSFLEMCLRGISFEDSIYGNETNAIRYPCMSIDWNGWDFAKYAYVTASSPSENPVIDYSDWTNTTYHRVLTHQFARFLRDHNLYTHIGGTTLKKARQMLRTGDILFFGNPNDSSYDGRFDSIYHCAIYVGWNKDGAPMILDCTSSDSNYPLRVRVAGSGHTADKLMGYARVPLGSRELSQQDLNLLIPTGSYAKRAESTESFRLSVKAELWNVYRVTVAYMYNNATDITASFPSITWSPSARAVNRLTADTQQATEINKWYVSDIIVPLDLDNAHFTDTTVTDASDRLLANFYPAATGSPRIRVLKVTPIMVDYSNGISDGVFELQNDYGSQFTSLTDVANFFKTSFVGQVQNCADMAFRFKSVAINGSAATVCVRIVRVRSDCYKIAVWDNTGGGVILNKKYNVTEPEITTYATNTFPYEQWMF